MKVYGDRRHMSLLHHAFFFLHRLPRYLVSVSWISSYHLRIAAGSAGSEASIVCSSFVRCVGLPLLHLKCRWSLSGQGRAFTSTYTDEGRVNGLHLHATQLKRQTEKNRQHREGNISWFILFLFFIFFYIVRDASMCIDIYIYTPPPLLLPH